MSITIFEFVVERGQSYIALLDIGHWSLFRVEIGYITAIEILGLRYRIKRK